MAQVIVAHSQYWSLVFEKI